MGQRVSPHNVNHTTLGLRLEKGPGLGLVCVGVCERERGKQTDNNCL